MKVNEHAVVAELAHALCQRIGEPRYLLWFRDKTKFSWDQDRLVVGVPNRFFQEWLERTFVQDVQEVASALAGRPIQVTFCIDPQLFQAHRQQTDEAKPLGEVPRTQGVAAEDPDARPRGEILRTPRVTQRKWRRLEDFVVGPCNRVAHAAAQSVVEAPGQGPNPLVFHGPVGTGKTHLLEGVYGALRRLQPDARVLFMSAEDFTNRFVQAMRLGKLAGFRKQFREADALLIDDVGFLARKLATQEEFLHTFDALHAAERPVVATCDCHPRLAGELMPELTDRLLGGAIWSLNLPEKETRLALLRAKRLGVRSEPLPPAVHEFLAEHLRGNVRELEGALYTLDHYARVTGRPISIELAREALAETLRHCVRVVQLDDVERAIGTALGLDKGALRSSQRAWMYSHPRMLAVYLARKHTVATYTELGRYFGGRSHSTAVAAEKKVRQWLKDDTVLNLGQSQARVRDVVERIERELLR